MSSGGTVGMFTAAGGFIGNLYKTTEARRSKWQPLWRPHVANLEGAAPDGREYISRKRRSDWLSDWGGRLGGMGRSEVSDTVRTQIGELRYISSATRPDSAARVGFPAPSMPAFQFSDVNDPHKRAEVTQSSSGGG